MKKDNKNTKGKFVCSECGEILTEENMHEFEGRVFCERCLDNHTTLCSGCGRRIFIEDSTEFDRQTMCVDCLNEQTSVCEACGRRMWNDDVCGDSNVVLCSDCEEYNYTNCDNCGRLIHRDEAHYDDDDYAYCGSCYEKLKGKPIHSYNYKPEPIFHGSGDLFYGVELEIDRGSNYDESAKILLDIANTGSEHIYCKHDGSIEYGFEIVSHPMTLDYHINNMNWLDVFNKAVEMGYRSHNTTTCGLHIHVNRSAFGETNDRQEDVISRIVYFVESHWNELLKFSRRTESSIMRWASRYGIADNTKLTYDKAKKNTGRYVAVNLANYYTVEFRIFRGTLRYKTFVAVLQLVDEICRQAILFCDKTFEGMSWSEFVSSISKADKPELIEYLKSKRLYVNEEVTETEEM